MGFFPPQPAVAASTAIRIVIFERERMKYAVVLLIGLTTILPGQARPDAAAAQGGQPRRSAEGAQAGLVRADGRALADAGGPFNALGATLFWGAWGYKADRPRLERNLEALRAAGIDYVRVLGSVGGSSWEDRQTDPQWSDYDSIIAGMTDLAYDRYGLRVQWTIFGGAPFTPAGAVREALVDRFAAMARGREHKILAFEIANEAWHNGFRGADGLAELRRLGKRLSSKTTVLVSLSAPANGAACATYAGAGADAMTVHYQRGFGREGPFAPVVRPWTFLSEHAADCRDQLPSLILNNEPIGPESSVEQDDSPSRIGASYVMTFLAGNASYVFHAGPGIRGGGAADVSSKLRRHAHFDELPSFAAIAASLKAAKAYLPPGLANWTRHESATANAPIRILEGMYLASKGSDFVALVTDVQHPIVLRARENTSIDVRQISTGKLQKRLTLSSVKDSTLAVAEPVVLIGQRMPR